MFEVCPGAYTDTSALKTTPLADSGINDGLAKLHPLHFTKMQTKINYSLLFTFSVEYSGVKHLNHKIIKSCGALCLIDDANVNNLILIITALCDSLEHMRLIR